VADRQCGIGFAGGGGGFTGGGDAKAAALVSLGRPQFQLRCLTEIIAVYFLVVGNAGGAVVLTEADRMF
jgi:hypothetical protein